ncbi:3-oxoadipate enol-lactone hydrolase/4-carboxymuconolactone decarboxylase [Streptococcus sp. DD11]|uniref:alpha/beta fold hydrolase n=1 Tax=Streptococcus sp. DD11 TaxID=1777879 RepID=UPI0007950BF5|nr:alpha/beta hydrolase [Streptococcus sp. DD11]KXT79640.1 3-oxoadipate enol-lactone hydrolase/4-carboxymuconolactone decarboxylase [Streptococcus sp. DD11]
MVYSAKNHVLHLADKSMDYVTFGRGEKPLVMIPGLGDGLATVRGMAQSLSFLYRRLGRAYKVYVFSRMNELPVGCSTRDMAGDLARAMTALGLTQTPVLGISQGGMIAQWLTLDFPAKVSRMILAVTAARANELSKERVGYWMTLAQADQYQDLMADIGQHSYSSRTYACLKYPYKLMDFFGKIKNKERLLIQAQACQEHDARAELARIFCPTLIVGAEKDDVLGLEASYELNRIIENSRLIVLPDCGHALYEKNKEFQQLVLEFLESNQ